MGSASVPLSDRARLAHLVMSTQQHRPLTNLARRYGWRAGAEIGVLRGKTLFNMLDALPALAMIGVDQWRHLPLRPDENAETYVDFDMGQLEHDVRARARGYGRRCRILKGDSVEVAASIADASLDFVFIDADHTEAGVERDIRAWAPKVKRGGAVLGHDCHWATVNRVIDRLCPGWAEHGEAVWSIPSEAVAL